MISAEINSKSIYVSDARHKTYVEVNEEGSEAAGATTIEVEIKSMPFELTGNHFRKIGSCRIKYFCNA
jgi:serine protease inhibitor